MMIINQIKRHIKIHSIKKYFAMRSLLPDFIIHSSNNKIKVRFLHSFAASWNVIRTICEAFSNDNKYDVLVIVGDCNGEDERIKQVNDDGFLGVKVTDNYDITIDKPDILVIYDPRDTTKLPGARESVKLIVVATMTLTRYARSISDYWNWAYEGFGRFDPNLYFFDSLMFNEIKTSPFFSNKIIEMGNAKYDGIYDTSVRDKNDLRRFRKLHGKKTFLWATDHGVYDGRISEDITFDLYARSIFEYFKQHSELGLIVRLHPTFVYEMMRYHYWTENDYRSFAERLMKSDNIVLDVASTYEEAFSYADAILTDGQCGIICSSLPLNKPTCILYRDKCSTVLHEEIQSVQYPIYCVEELIEFFRMVEEDLDYKKEKRSDVINKCVKHFDGHNGERIKRRIEDEFGKML